jgi:hypothetical protein
MQLIRRDRLVLSDPIHELMMSPCPLC